MGDTRFQFRLLSLILVTVFCCFLVASLWAWPNNVGVFVLYAISIAAPPLLAVEVVYGTGYKRVFCLGAFFPSSLLVFGSGGSNVFLTVFWRMNPVSDQAFYQFRWAFIITWIIAIICGLLCCGRLWMIKRGEDDS